MTPALRIFDGPINCVILGQLNVGKSTLLNQIVGKASAPIGYNETTENISRFQYGTGKQCNKFRVYYRDREPEDHPHCAIKDWIENGNNSSATVLLDFFVDSEFLQNNNIVFIDTQGTGSTQTRHKEEIQQLLQGEHKSTTQHGVVPHILIYVVGDARPETISNLDEYTQALGILPECTIVVVQSPDGNAEDICELLREDLGNRVSIVHEIEPLKDKLSKIPNPDELIQLLTAYRIAADIHGKSVETLEEIFEKENAHKQRTEELRDSLKSDIEGAGSTPEISLRKSIETLQTEMSEPSPEDLQEFFKDDLQKLGEVVTGVRKVLQETRDEIANLQGITRSFGEKQSKFDKTLQQEEQRIKNFRQVWGDRLSGLPQIVGDDVETHIKPTVQDFQKHFDDLPRGIEEQITHVNQLLGDLQKIKDEIQQEIDLFELDIRYLMLLGSSALDLEKDDRKELLCLFGQSGTDRLSRLKRKPADQDEETYISERISYWSSKLSDAIALGQAHAPVLDHALARLESMPIE